MPAARVDIKIAPNTNPRTDIGGAGALVKADKTEVYSRDGNGTDSAHNLYAPFYSQFVPATAAGDDASGTDWFVQNNFGLNYFGEYDNWDTLPLRTVLPTATGCNRTVDFEGGAADHPRSTPSGDQTVAVFTDEHGEAQVGYVPFAGGFYYDAVGGIVNDNRGCDLQDVDVLGTSAISATAKYPGQPPALPAHDVGDDHQDGRQRVRQVAALLPEGPGRGERQREHRRRPRPGRGRHAVRRRARLLLRRRQRRQLPAVQRRHRPGGRAVPRDVGPGADAEHDQPRRALRVPRRQRQRRARGASTAAIRRSTSSPSTSTRASCRDIDAVFGAGDGPGDPPSTDPPPNTPGGDTGPSTAPAPTRRPRPRSSRPPAAARIWSTGRRPSTKTVKTRIAKARVVRVGAKRYLVVKVKSSHKRVKAGSSACGSPMGRSSRPPARCRPTGRSASCACPGR